MAVYSLIYDISEFLYLRTCSEARRVPELNLSSLVAFYKPVFLTAAPPQDPTRDYGKGYHHSHGVLKPDISQPQDARAGKGDASAPLAAPAINRHDEFYFTDEMTVFQVCHHHLIYMQVRYLPIVM